MLAHAISTIFRLVQFQDLKRHFISDLKWPNITMSRSGNFILTSAVSANYANSAKIVSINPKIRLGRSDLSNNSLFFRHESSS